MNPVRQGDGVGLSAAGFSEVREGDGTVLWSQGGAIPDSGVARYEWEQTATDSWNDNDLSLSGGTYTTDSAVGSYAVSLDGSDDIATRTGLAMSGGVSIMAWVRNPSGASNRDYAMGSSSNFWIGVDGSEYFSRMSNADNSINATTADVRGQGWIHVGTTISSGGDVTDYVGGSSAYSYTTNQTIDFSSADFAVGNRGGDIDASRYWEGEIDDVRLYDKELTATEVSNLESTRSI